MSSPQPGPLNLLRPILLLSYSLWYLPITIYNLILAGDYKTLLDFESLKSAWFARFWAFFGPLARDFAAEKVMPLLQNNAHGVCLDIGPGSGQWLYLFAKAMNPSITKIYGIEPNKALHAELRANANKAGLGDIYEIIGCGAEELATKGGIQKGSIDTIITVQCLCSIPDPQRNINELYPLLKPGGVWLVYEHVRTPFQSSFVGPWQRSVNLLWPHCFGGCELTRETGEWIQKSGDWASIKMKAATDDGPYATVPHVIGTLTKR